MADGGGGFRIKYQVESKRVWPKVPGVVVVDSHEAAAECVAFLRTQTVVGVDTEFTGVDLKKEHPKGKARAISLQLAGLTGPRYFIPLWDEYEGLLDSEIGRWLEDETAKTKVGHNTKIDMHVLANHGIVMRGVLADTWMMDYLQFNAEKKHALKECIRRYSRKIHNFVHPYSAKDSVDYGEMFRAPKPLKRKGKNGETLYGKGTYVQPLDEVIETDEGIEKLITYSVKDPFFTAKLYAFLRDQMKRRAWSKTKGNYFDYYEMFELPFLHVLFDMEREGCPVDIDHLRDVEKRLDVDVAAVEKEFFTLCAKRGVAPSMLEKFNLGSTKQLCSMLYETLGVPINPAHLTAKGAPGTGKAAMETLATSGKKNAKFGEVILSYRAKTTLRKMFVKKLVHYSPQYQNRAHSTYKQPGTNTGRLASAAHNLQNIPTGKKDDVYKLRSAFIAPKKGVHHIVKGGHIELCDEEYVLADIDLSQIEVRLTAHYTGEKKLIDMLVNGHDQHLMAACSLFDKVKEFVGGKPCTKALNEEGEKLFGKAQWGEWRRRAKILNFGIIYGMGPKGFQLQCGSGTSKEEAKEAIENYFRGFPDLRRGIKRVQNKCYQQGYIRTFLGRYCELPDIRSEDFSKKGAAERQAFNYKIQGSAADLLKMAMILIHRDRRLRKWGVRMVLQIHDELVLIVPKRYYEAAKPIIEDYVSRPYHHFGMKGLVVETPADLGCGPNWMEAKK